MMKQNIDSSSLQTAEITISIWIQSEVMRLMWLFHWDIFLVLDRSIVLSPLNIWISIFQSIYPIIAFHLHLLFFVIFQLLDQLYPSIEAIVCFPAQSIDKLLEVVLAHTKIESRNESHGRTLQRDPAKFHHMDKQEKRPLILRHDILNEPIQWQVQMYRQMYLCQMIPKIQTEKYKNHEFIVKMNWCGSLLTIKNMRYVVENDFIKPNTLPQTKPITTTRSRPNLDMKII